MHAEPLPPLPIATAAQETGFSKDVLRAWERRYGFPAPLRDRRGDRLYPEDQIRRLRLIRILVDLGERPGKLMALNEAQLAGRVATLRHDECADPPQTLRVAAVADGMALVAGNDFITLEVRLNAEIVRLGVERFATEVAAPLCQETGLAWERGDIGVHQEHLFSQVLARCLRQTIALMGAQRAPGTRFTVLLTTPPGEIHELGLLMVEAVLWAQGVACLNLGAQLPVRDVVAAVQAHDCAVVALSVSSWFDARRAHALLVELRERLPSQVGIWAGGANAALRRELPAGIRTFTQLGQIEQAVGVLA